MAAYLVRMCWKSWNLSHCCTRTRLVGLQASTFCLEILESARWCDLIQLHCIEGLMSSAAAPGSCCSLLLMELLKLMPVMAGNNITASLWSDWCSLLHYLRDEYGHFITGQGLYWWWTFANLLAMFLLCMCGKPLYFTNSDKEWHWQIVMMRYTCANLKIKHTQNLPHEILPSPSNSERVSKYFHGRTLRCPQTVCIFS